MKKIIFVLGIICLLIVPKVFAETEKCQVELKDVHVEFKNNIFLLDGKEIAKIDPFYGMLTGNVPDGVIKYYMHEENIYLIFHFKYDASKKFDIFQGYKRDLIAIYDINGDIPEGLYCKEGKLNGNISVYEHMEYQLFKVNYQYEDGQFKETQRIYLGNEEEYLMSINEVKEPILLKIHKNGFDVDQREHPGLGLFPANLQPVADDVQEEDKNSFINILKKN